MIALARASSDIPHLVKPVLQLQDDIALRSISVVSCNHVCFFTVRDTVAHSAHIILAHTHARHILQKTHVYVQDEQYNVVAAE